jgi:hypothetical protein
MAQYGKEPFKAGLEELGFEVTDHGENRLSFRYRIGAGRFENTEVDVGIDVPPDFDVTCPTGPHIKPRLIPLSSANDSTRAADSSFGSDWEYLSRPFSENQQGWNRVTRGVKAYIRHIRRILETL